MSGSGNDFILINNLDKSLSIADAADFARQICRRRFGVGADGLIILEPSSRADFSWRFYNADGTMPEMCGNGGRCAARFAFLKGLAGSQMTFETLAGIIAAEVNGQRVKIKMVPPVGLLADIPLRAAGQALVIHSIDTGVPHVVVFVEDLANTDVLELGREIRWHPAFQPAGTNVDFVCSGDQHSLHVRTFERGVEGETLACGTGATAAALVGAYKGLVQSPVAVHTRGGEILTISFASGRPDFGDVYLEGEVKVVYEGILWEEAVT